MSVYFRISCSSMQHFIESVIMHALVFSFVIPVKGIYGARHVHGLMLDHNERNINKNMKVE